MLSVYHDETGRWGEWQASVHRASAVHARASGAPPGRGSAPPLGRLLSLLSTSKQDGRASCFRSRGRLPPAPPAMRRARRSYTTRTMNVHTHTTRLTWEAQDTELSTWGRRAAPRHAGRGRGATMIAAGSHPLAGVAGGIQELSLLQEGKRRGGRETRHGSGDMYAVGWEQVGARA